MVPAVGTYVEGIVTTQRPKTIARWTQAGKLDPIPTPGGHRRFRASEVRRCLQEDTAEEVKD